MGEIKARGREVVASLSGIEREFLRRLVEGQSQSAIAAHLKLDEAEACSVKQSLMRKLGAGCTADAVREGIYAGL